MRSGAGKPKTTAGRRRPAATAAPDRGRLKRPAPPDSPEHPPPHGPGAQLVHELGGTLATVSLHLRVAAEQPLPGLSAQHIDAAAAALLSTRNQLTQLAELLLRLERAGKLQRSP